MRVWFLALLMLATALSGCAGAGQFGVSNQPGNFNMGGQVAGKTESLSYTWENPGSTAKVQWGGQSSSGTVQVSIRDAAGKTVYGSTFGGTGQGGASDSTSSGKAGQWQIVVEFNDFTGQVGLSIQGGAGVGGVGGYGGYGGHGGGTSWTGAFTHPAVPLK